jgi:hypothetical protein
MKGIEIIDFIGFRTRNYVQKEGKLWRSGAAKVPEHLGKAMKKAFKAVIMIALEGLCAMK